MYKINFYFYFQQKYKKKNSVQYLIKKWEIVCLLVHIFVLHLIYIIDLYIIVLSENE